MDTKIKYARVDELHLDPKNPRLGRHNTAAELSPDAILEIMSGWSLEELAVSFLENGFWPQEALLIVEEPLGKKTQKVKVVVEGNRRLAALKYLMEARAGKATAKWREIASTGSAEDYIRLSEIPYITADSREDIQAYLGFRHVTGIRQWDPAEKAEYIARMIDEHGMTYEQVMRKIGSKTPTVRQNYISYRLLLQMENSSENISVEHVEDKFSVLFLSLRSEGTQTYLDIDMQAPPERAHTPVPAEKLKQLANFALWLFGDDKHTPVVTDSRQVDKFGEVLLSPAAVEYLERADRPNLETAYRLAGGDEAGTIKLLERAADGIEQALSTVHHFKKSGKMKKAVHRVGMDASALLDYFPDVKKGLSEDT